MDKIQDTILFYYLSKNFDQFQNYLTLMNWFSNILTFQNGNMISGGFLQSQLMVQRSWLVDGILMLNIRSPQRLCFFFQQQRWMVSEEYSRVWNKHTPHLASLHDIALIFHPNQPNIISNESWHLYLPIEPLSTILSCIVLS